MFHVLTTVNLLLPALYEKSMEVEGKREGEERTQKQALAG